MNKLTEKGLSMYVSTVRRNLFILIFFIALTSFGFSAEVSETVFSLNTEDDFKNFEQFWGQGGFEIDSRVKDEADFSIKMTAKQHPASIAIRTQYFPYTGQSIRIKGRVRSQVAEARYKMAPVLQVYTYDKDMQPLGGHKDIISVPIGKQDWTSFDKTLDPYNEVIKYYCVSFNDNWINNGTVWLEGFEVIETSEKRNEIWQPMLTSKSFSIDEGNKGDWKLLFERDWSHKLTNKKFLDVKGRDINDKTLDWDGYRLTESADNAVYTNEDVCHDGAGARSLLITGGATYAGEYLPYNGEMLRFSAMVKVGDVSRGRAYELSPSSQTTLCILSVQIAFFKYEEGVYYYKSHKDLFAVVSPDKANFDWKQVENEISDTGSTHIRLLIRMWEGRTGRFLIDKVNLEKLEEDELLLDKDSSRIAVDLTQSQGDLRKMWQGVDAVMEDFNSETVSGIVLPELNRSGIKYVRIHRGLYGAWEKNNPDGSPIYDWSLLNNALDMLVKNKLKPMIITEPSGVANASKPTTSWVNVSPPKDMIKHGKFIEAAARHCIERYGLEEVRTWYWEVWNEPWFVGYFDGTLEQYLEVYDHTATALKRVDSEIMVGSIVYDDIDGMLRHFAEGFNKATGKKAGVPIDFITYHGYGGTLLPSIKSFEASYNRIDRHKQKYPQLADVKIINGEWNPCYIGSAHAETHYNAAAIAKTLRIMYDVGVAQSFLHVMWVSDGIYRNIDGQQVFGLNSIELITRSGIPTAAINAIRCLDMLQGQRGVFERQSEPIDGIASFDKENNQAGVLLINFVEDPSEKFTTDVSVEIKVPQWMVGEQIQMQRYVVDSSHSDAYALWEKMGRPHTTNKAQERRLKQASDLHLFQTDSIEDCPEQLNVNFGMDSHSLTLIILKTE